MSLDSKAITDVKIAIKMGNHAGGFAQLRHALSIDAPFVDQARAAKLYSSIATKSLNLRPLRIAIVPSSTADHLADVLKYWLATVGFDANIYIAPFDMVVQTVFDKNSPLYAFKPDIVWLFTGYRDIHLEISGGAEKSLVEKTIRDAVCQQMRLWEVILSQLNCIILQNNADLPAHDPFGNIAGAAMWGARAALRLYNVELAAAAPPSVIIFDIDHLASEFGRRQWFDERYWFHSKHAFSLDAIGLVAHSAARLIAAAKGSAKKCLVLDLDNTLWGGVIGDDGVDGIRLGAKADGEAYMAFQSYVLALKERGVILAVCSKNDDANAKEPFERHPDMRLRLDDIAVFRANWNNKVDNIRDIAATLNIGIDSIVFADDNPAERAVVRQFLPMVEVPELPEDPAGYIAAISRHRYFEAVAFSVEDRERARYYQENAKRAELRLSFQDTADYLRGLDMSGEVGSLDTFHLPRMAQLINKSNQFHLTGTRYSEADLLAMNDNAEYVLRHFKLRDRFGDNGLIAVLVLRVASRTLHIDTWVMSCRVLARSMEEFICNEIMHVARERGCIRIEGLYRRSAKNGLVADLYERLGFTRKIESDNTVIWDLEVSKDTPEWTTYVRNPSPAEG